MRTTWLWTAAVVGICAVIGLVAQTRPPHVPVPVIRTELGTRPGVAALPTRPEMPDVLVTDGGQRVTTPSEWARRREEMKQTLAYYATGLMPPPPGNVRGPRRTADCYAACTENDTLTSSPTRNPPVSSAAFQVRPKSLRLMTVSASKPYLAFPHGSLATPR